MISPDPIGVDGERHKDVPEEGSRRKEWRAGTIILLFLLGALLVTGGIVTGLVEVNADTLVCGSAFAPEQNFPVDLVGRSESQERCISVTDPHRWFAVGLIGLGGLSIISGIVLRKRPRTS